TSARRREVREAKEAPVRLSALPVYKRWRAHQSGSFDNRSDVAQEVWFLGFASDPSKFDVGIIVVHRRACIRSVPGPRAQQAPEMNRAPGSAMCVAGCPRKVDR